MKYYNEIEDWEIPVDGYPDMSDEFDKKQEREAVEYMKKLREGLPAVIAENKRRSEGASEF
jgi:hypothetical protein